MLHKTDQTREEEQKMNQGWGEKSPKQGNQGTREKKKEVTVVKKKHPLRGGQGNLKEVT